MFKSFFKKLKGEPSKKSFKDPVCGMRASDEITVQYKEQTYAFCSDHCRRQFNEDPEVYISK